MCTQVKMFCSLKHCIRTVNKSSVLIGIRSCSQFTEQNHSKFGKNGHYDIIIVGGGAAGISLAGSIGKSQQNFDTIFKFPNLHNLFNSKK